jgi:hypothetical protein
LQGLLRARSLEAWRRAVRASAGGDAQAVGRNWGHG